MKSVLLAAGLIAVVLPAQLGCSREDLVSNDNLTENVKKAFADCNPDEISFLAAKENLQTAFRNCGSNNFSHFEWSPDGVNVYFQLTSGAYVMNGEKKTISSVPSPLPIAGGTWLSNDLLAIPVGPKVPEGASSKQTERPERILLYNLASHTLEAIELPVKAPRDLQPWGKDNELLLTAISQNGRRQPWVLDTSTGKITRAFPWLDGAVDRLVYAPKANLVAWSVKDTTHLVQADSGATVMDLPGMSRAIPHPEGRYVALETLGSPLSPFDQKAWDDLSAEARAREQARRKQFIARLPDWAPREIRPPELQIVDLKTGGRWRITAFNGDHFEWYQPRDYWCSFILWGIEGKQLNRNIALTDLAERLRLAGKGEVPRGLEVVRDAEPDPAGPDR